MNWKLPLVIAVLLCAHTTTTHSQTQANQPTLPLVTYNDNVNATLTTSERQQLEEVYGDKLNAYVLSKPSRLKAIKDILRNRIEIIEISKKSDQKPCTLLSEVPLFDYYVPDLKRDVVFNKSTFNPLKYNFNFYSRGSHMYRVDNTNYFILIKSQHQR